MGHLLHHQIILLKWTVVYRTILMAILRQIKNTHQVNSYRMKKIYLTSFKYGNTSRMHKMIFFEKNNNLDILVVGAMAGVGLTMLILAFAGGVALFNFLKW